ncbi:hypothetical protein [Tsukamurella sp. PLM1]|uniref:hypothetical protein n=1 Tax=Tsukamurella sp. PLM1 TaxID=2929795 RepID=UPI002068C852|nr:hypothetical protein [Tsukamurella sp. PLM1]BDH55923.1 hypothetical protein MTP03_08620 [Tsukamurella sp. PLM1]
MSHDYVDPYADTAPRPIARRPGTAPEPPRPEPDPARTAPSKPANRGPKIKPYKPSY